MDRSREARRSSSMATTNGLPRRRQRSTSLRDSPEEGQVELQETVRLRDRASKRDRDRELLKSRSKRRRGPNREGGEESTEESVGEEEEEEEDDEEEEFQVSDNHRRNFPPARGSRQWKVADKMIGVPVPRKARSASAKRAHENCVSGNGGVVEEPARPSPEVRSPSSSNVSVRKKMKPREGPPPRTRPSKAYKNFSEEDIEIEIAEVLFGLKKQSQSNKAQESNGNELEPRDTKGFAHDSRPSLSSPQSDPAFGVGAVEKSSIAAKAEKVESEQQPAKMDSCSPRASSHESMESQQEATLKREDSKPSGIGDEKPISAPPCAESDVVFDDLQNSTAGTKADPAVPEAGRSKQEEKFEIDLMALPMAASPDREGNGFTNSISDPKAPVKKEEKVERFVKEVVVEEPEEEKKKEKKRRRREAIGEKRELPKLDLEKPNQDSGSGVRSTNKSQQQQQQWQENQAKASIPKVENTSQSGLTPLPIAASGWPGGLPPLGYMPPYQTVMAIDANTPSTASSQPPPFFLSRPRPKRCTTHHYIARSIQLHQQFSKTNNIWPVPAATAALGGAKTSKLNFMPSAEKVIVANPFQGSFPSVNLNAVQEKGQAGTNFPSHIGKDKGSEAFNLMDTAQRNPLVFQQAPQAVPTGSSMHGPAFMFPMSQHPAAAVANQSGLSKPSNPAKNVSLPSNSATGPPGSSSALPAVTTAMSFSYPNFPPNETPYMAILQNNVYPFPISTPIGTTSALRGSTPAQTMPFLNGSFYSPQMFHSSQLQQQQPQVQACHQNTSTSSGSSSSHKQPRGAQVGGNNLLASASMQLQQPHKQHVLPSNQSRNLEVEITAENPPSVADSQSSHAKESVYRQKNFTVPVQHFRLMPSAGSSGSSGGNHGEKQQQHGLKGAVELFPSPAFAMSFADFNGNKTAFSGNNMVSALNFSSLPQNPVIFQSLPDMAQLGYQVTPAPQAAQQKSHQVSEGKSGGGSSTSNDAKKATSGKPSTTTGQTLVFDINSAQTLSFMPSTGNWPPRYVTSTALMANGPLAGNTSNSQQQQLLQLQVQQHHMLPQQQPAAGTATRSKALTTNNNLSSSSTITKFPNNPPVYSQALIQGNSSVQSSQSKNTGRSPSSLKNMSQQQGRAPPGHNQISFGGDPKSALAPHVQPIVAHNHHSSSTSAAGTPTAGNSRTNATGGKAGASVNTLQSQQTENSSTRAGQKSSPVCGRNVPSILSTCTNHLSELKY
ncbi:hypothetical protein FH972_006148 [Carpinus fangiana]|uniref:Protein TIME FOR COFFEE n=1 Tax=Carpinus fangiana TaxID=176857 RepID=A0A5N6QRE3_9ROSI|nr:hypothetical protein FH972_006148 [Carpinus fangiana]